MVEPNVFEAFGPAIKEGRLEKSQIANVLFESKIQRAEKCSLEELREDTAVYFYKKGHHRLAVFLAAIFLIRSHSIITNERTDEIKAYDPDLKYFRSFGVSIIKKTLSRILHHQFTSKVSSEILHHVRSRTYVTEEQIREAAPLDLIPLRNGVYSLSKKKLLPHDPKYMFDYQHPVFYSRKARCKKIRTFFSEIVAEEDLPRLYDIFACALYRKNFLEKFFILVGQGANGKSKFISLLQEFVGEENHSSIDLIQLTEDKFAAARTYRKLLNVGADIGSRPITDTSMIKAASASDRISGQFKYGQIFDWVPTATQVFSANQPPRFHDDSKGMYRRIETIMFPFSFGNEADRKDNPDMKKADPNILEGLTTKSELSGLLNVALEHLHNIIENKQLSVVQSTKQLRSSYLLMSNPIQSFLEEYCVEAEYIPADKVKGKVERIPAQGFVSVADLYDRFVAFCKSKNINRMSKDMFCKRLKKIPEWNLDFGQKDFVNSSGNDKIRSVRGITWKFSKANPADSANPANPSFLFCSSEEKNKETSFKPVKGGLGVLGAVQHKCNSCGSTPSHGWILGKPHCRSCGEHRVKMEAVTFEVPQ